jgi:hypothetical protein
VVRISKENPSMKPKGRNPSIRPRSRWKQDVRRNMIQKEVNLGGTLESETKM